MIFFVVVVTFEYFCYLRGGHLKFFFFTHFAFKCLWSLCFKVYYNVDLSLCKGSLWRWSHMLEQYIHIYFTKCSSHICSEMFTLSLHTILLLHYLHTYYECLKITLLSVIEFMVDYVYTCMTIYGVLNMRLFHVLYHLHFHALWYICILIHVLYLYLDCISVTWFL